MSVRVEPHSLPGRRPRVRLRWHDPHRSASDALALPRVALRSMLLSIVDSLARRPELALVLFAAATLRLLLLDQTSFLADQAELLFLARSAIAHHALPVTGIRSSVGTLSFPVSIFLLLPFALLGDPLGATVATALANVFAALLLYSVVDRYAGRRAAFAAGLLYATAPWPVYFSRFIWQQNLLAPVVLLFIWTLCRGVIERRSGWLGWNVLWWCVAVQLHPSAGPLLVLTGVGLLLAWRTIRLGDVVGAVVGACVLFAPTIIWEVVSNGSDVVLFGALGQAPAVVNGDVFNQLFTVLTPPGPSFFGDGTLYARVYTRFAWLPPVLGMLNIAAMVWLPLIVIWRLLRRGGRVSAVEDQPTTPGTAPMARRRWPKKDAPASATSKPTLDTRTRFLVIVLLWLYVPVLAMWRHATPIHEHYLLAPLPAGFVLLGIFLAWLVDVGRGIGARVMLHRHGAAKDFHAISVIRTVSGRSAPLGAAGFPARVRHVATRRLRECILVASILVISLAQAFSAAGQIATVWRGDFDGTQQHGYTHYGLPLAVQREALDAAMAAAAQTHAVIYIATTNLQQESFGYLATESGVHAQIYDASRCLIVPAPHSAPAVVLVTESPGAGISAGSLLAAMPGVKLLRTLRGQTNTAVRLYFVPGGAHAVGETRPISDRKSSDLHLGGYSLLQQGSTGATLALRWEGTPGLPVIQDGTEYWYGWQGSAAGTPLSRYWFKAQAVDKNGQLLGDQQATTCSYLTWGHADTVYALIDVPAQPHTAQAIGWRVWVERQALRVRRPQIGPLHLQSGDVQLEPNMYVPGSATIQQ